MHRQLEPDREEDLDAADRVAEEEEAAERDEDIERRSRALVRFERVTASMAQILAPNPGLRIDGEISLSDERGLEELYAAARGSDDGRHIPGLTRMKKLNQALALLRPALVAGMDASLPEQRKTYEGLGDQVGDLRHRITQRIYVEAVGFGGGADFEEGEAEEDTEADEEELDSAVGDEDLARVDVALEIFTDELALAAGRRRGRSALAVLAGAARALASRDPNPAAQAASLAAVEEALREVMADPEAALADLELAEPEPAQREIESVCASAGDAPRGGVAARAAARILEGAARAGAGGAR